MTLKLFMFYIVQWDEINFEEASYPLSYFQRYSPCPFGSGLRKFVLDLVVVIFFKNEEITSGGLILYLEKFGLILHFNFLQTIFM